MTIYVVMPGADYEGFSDPIAAYESEETAYKAARRLYAERREPAGQRPLHAALGLTFAWDTYEVRSVPVLDLP